MTTSLRVITEERLQSTGAKWKLQENYNGQSALSCRQAVTIRNRLGSGEHGGVPLWTELKSQIGKAITGNSTIWFACHTRANTGFSISKLAKFLKIDEGQIQLDGIEGLSNANVEEDAQHHSNIFGLVNPFNIDVIFESFGVVIDPDQFLQIFDKSVLIDGGYPNTLTTNVGDRRYAIEMAGKEFISKTKHIFPKTVVEDISSFDPIWLGQGGEFVKMDWVKFPPPFGPKIGILTGNSPESGRTLWTDILHSFRNCYRNTPDTLMPEIMISSLPQMGLSMELIAREKEVWLHMRKAILDLLESGCKIITIACNTTIYYRPKIIELCNKFSARFVSIAEACTQEIGRQFQNLDDESDHKVGIIGIGPVIDMGGNYSGYKPYLVDEGYSVTPVNGEELAYIMKNIGDDTKVINKTVGQFRNLIRKEFADINIIILALTEVSMVYRQHIERSKKNYQSKYIYIDPLKELGWFIVQMYITMGYRMSKVCSLPEEFDVELFWNDKIQKMRVPDK